MTCPPGRSWSLFSALRLRRRFVDNLGISTIQAYIDWMSGSADREHLFAWAVSFHVNYKLPADLSELVQAEFGITYVEDFHPMAYAIEVECWCIDGIPVGNRTMSWGATKALYR